MRSSELRGSRLPAQFAAPLGEPGGLADVPSRAVRIKRLGIVMAGARAA